jgi:hypothetical protein
MVAEIIEKNLEFNFLRESHKTNFVASKHRNSRFVLLTQGQSRMPLTLKIQLPQSC